ncbi:MAG: helix-turn-helix domain-containing protein [Acidobacteriaceae bacterium]
MSATSPQFGFPSRFSPPPPARADAQGVTQRFGQKLRFLRKSKSMTQLQMAIYLGIDRSYISDLERGKKSVSLPTLEVIALGFHMSLSDLLSGI